MKTINLELGVDTAHSKMKRQKSIVESDLCQRTVEKLKLTLSSLMRNFLGAAEMDSIFRVR